MNKWRLFRTWHRWLGLGITVFVLLLSITGVMLNHAEKLKLNDVTTDADWLMSWYGIDGLSDDAVSFQIDDQWITSGNGWLYLNDKAIATTEGQVIGAVQTDLLVIVASSRKIYLFTHQGEQIEVYTPEGFDAEITAVGLSEGRPVVQAGEMVFKADEDVAIWQPYDGDYVWSESTRFSEAYLSAINQHLRGGGLPFSRVLLDLHSGRFFAASGPLIMDAVAVILVLLNGLGVWLWWARR